MFFRLGSYSAPSLVSTNSGWELPLKSYQQVTLPNYGISSIMEICFITTPTRLGKP